MILEYEDVVLTILILGFKDPHDTGVLSLIDAEAGIDLYWWILVLSSWDLGVTSMTSLSLVVHHNVAEIGITPGLLLYLEIMLIWCFFIQSDLLSANVFRASVFQSLIFPLIVKFVASYTSQNDIAVSTKFTCNIPEPAIILIYNRLENIEPYHGNWKMEDYMYQKVTEKWENKCFIVTIKM